MHDPNRAGRMLADWRGHAGTLAHRIEWTCVSQARQPGAIPGSRCSSIRGSRVAQIDQDRRRGRTDCNRPASCISAHPVCREVSSTDHDLVTHSLSQHTAASVGRHTDFAPLMIANIGRHRLDPIASATRPTLTPVPRLPAPDTPNRQSHRSSYNQ